MTRHLLTVAAVLAVASDGNAGLRSAAQITARQGAVDTSKRFTSPMVLEAALPVPAVFGQVRFGNEVADFTCDDVSLTQLTYQVVGNKKDPSKPTDMDFAGFIVVPNSFDREVDVLFTVKHGGEPIGSRGKFRISAEEGRRTAFRVRVPVRRLDRVRDRDNAPTVEITVTVRDNS